ncbi:hypothetical protein AJ87_03005 [Rhizobium yanglingense]|nr:hypothetical protein AJ87_03005 [Rhizobium yanglingense]
MPGRQQRKSIIALPEDAAGKLGCQLVGTSSDRHHCGAYDETSCPLHSGLTEALRAAPFPSAEALHEASPSASASRGSNARSDRGAGIAESIVADHRGGLEERAARADAACDLQTGRQVRMIRVILVVFPALDVEGLVVALAPILAGSFSKLSGKSGSTSGAKVAFVAAFSSSR